MVAVAAAALLLVMRLQSRQDLLPESDTVGATAVAIAPATADLTSPHDPLPPLSRLVSAGSASSLLSAQPLRHELDALVKDGKRGALAVLDIGGVRGWTQH